MLDTAIMLSFLILVTLLGIELGFAAFLSAFASVTFVLGFLLVLTLYLSRYPRITFTCQTVDKTPGFNDSYNINFLVNDKSISSHDYRELVLYLEKGTLLTKDTNAEVIGAYAKRKNFPWPYTDGIRFPMDGHRVSGNKSLVQTFPLVVPKDTETTKITAVLYLHSNSYASGPLAIFNPIYNYAIKGKVEVDLTDLLNEPPPTEKKTL